MCVQVGMQQSPMSSRRTPHGSVASGGSRPRGGRMLALGGRTPQSAAPAAAQLTFQACSPVFSSPIFSFSQHGYAVFLQDDCITMSEMN